MQNQNKRQNAFILHSTYLEHFVARYVSCDNGIEKKEISIEDKKLLKLLKQLVEYGLKKIKNGKGIRNRPSLGL